MSFDIGKTIQCNHIDWTGKSWATSNLISGCPKCGGWGTYYDFEWNEADGSVRTVIGLNLLQEFVVKAVITIKGTNPFHPEYGTAISDSVAALATESYVKRMVEHEVAAALGQVYLRQQMQQQAGQELSEDELIYEIAKVVLRFIDERTISIYLSIVTESGREIEFTV